jgi:hypothetical protein
MGELLLDLNGFLIFAALPVIGSSACAFALVSYIFIHPALVI